MRRIPFYNISNKLCILKWWKRFWVHQKPHQSCIICYWLSTAQLDLTNKVQCLTLGALPRVMVVLCVYPSVCYNTSCYTPCLYIHWVQDVIKLFMVILTNESCEFCWKHFIQKFWRHLVTILAFFTSWYTLDVQKRQWRLLFNQSNV